jgi:hypothetical protein
MLERHEGLARASLVELLEEKDMLTQEEYKKRINKK